MSPTILLLSGIVILVTHLIGAITAYGSSLLALPILVWLIGDLTTSVVAILLVGTVQSYLIAAFTFRDVDWRELRRVVVWAGIGLPIGVLSMRYLPERLLLLCLAGVLVASGGAWLTPALRRTLRPSDRVLNALLFCGGIIHGAFACGGATLAIYAQYALVKKERIRGTLCMIWVILNTVVVASAIAHGRLTPRVERLSLTTLPFMLLGCWAGDRAARRMKQDRFSQLMAVVLVAAGVITVLRVMR